MVEQKTQRLIAVALIIMGLLLGLAAVVYRLQSSHELSFKEQLLLDQALNEVALQIQKRYEQGDSEGYLQKNPQACAENLGSLANVHPFFLRCNADYLQCYFSGQAGTKPPEYFVHLGKEKERVRIRKSEGRFVKVLSRSLQRLKHLPDYALEMNLSVDKFPHLEKTILLENTCQDTYLPRRAYTYGPLKQPGMQKKARELAQGREVRWDNFGSDIFINKYLVTGRDVLEWKKLTGQKINKDESEGVGRAKPSTDLTLSERQAFCAFRGEHLLEAQLFDAATFMPDDKSKDPRTFWRYPYPWGSQREDQFFVKGRSTEVDQDSCQLIYSQSCSTFPVQDYDNASTSWIEFNQILGGVLESLRNPIDPPLNVKASSFYFLQGSSWHQLGRRAQWQDGRFEWKDLLHQGILPQVDEAPLGVSDKNLLMGFRCYHFFGEGRS